MSKDPTLIVLSNDLPDASYGAERLAAAFTSAFDVRVVDPTGGFGGPASWLASKQPAAFVHDGRAVLARACSFFSGICRADGVARP
jgi:hypothetical protein